MTTRHIRTIAAEWDWETALPPAPAVRAGDTIYLSGQIALGRDGSVVGVNDLAAQARQCFANIRSILARDGATMQDVVKMTTYFACPLTDEVTAEYWQIRKEVFGTHRPASTGVSVSALIYPEVMLEIEAIAVLAPARHA